MKPTMNPAGYALVTGSSRGIGRYFAFGLARRSWDVILVARTQDRLEQVASELTSAFGVRAETIAMDLTAAGAPGELARQLAARKLDVDMLVNNAGIGKQGEFMRLSLEDQSTMIRLNALALLELTHHLLPPMIARRRGTIINVSSTAGFQPMPYVAVYAATKSFVTSFSMALAEELRASGVRVVTLCPGPTRTVAAEQDPRSEFPGGKQPAEDVVEEALRAADLQDGLVVPRLINKVIAFSNRLMPLRLSARAVGRATRP
jgi:uncharacterized protein